MSRIVGNDKARAFAWAAPRLGISGSDGWEHFSALFLEKGGDIQAVVLYKNYIPANSVEIHLAAVAGGRWLTRAYLRAAFQYPFEQLGVRVIVTLVAGDNVQSRRFTEHIGWTLSGMIQEGWRGNVDLLIYSMRKRECRFLGSVVEQALNSDASRPRDNRGGADGIEPLNGDNKCRIESRQHQHTIW